MKKLDHVNIAGADEQTSLVIAKAVKDFSTPKVLIAGGEQRLSLDSLRILNPNITEIMATRLHIPGTLVSSGEPNIAKTLFFSRDSDVSIAHNPNLSDVSPESLIQFVSDKIRFLSFNKKPLPDFITLTQPEHQQQVVDSISAELGHITSVTLRVITGKNPEEISSAIFDALQSIFGDPQKMQAAE